MTNKRAEATPSRRNAVHNERRQSAFTDADREMRLKRDRGLWELAKLGEVWQRDGMAMRTTMEQCEETVRRYLLDCQEAGNVPSETHYKKWRGKKPKPDFGDEEIGNPWAPTLDAIKLHGPDTFTRLLEKLGVKLPPKPEAPRPYSEAECVQALTGFLRHCWQEHQRSTESNYLVWHEARKQDTPSSDQIRAKFGRWTKARDRAVLSIGQPPAP